MGSALGSCFKSTGKYNIINGVHGNGHIKQSPPPEAATGGGEDPSEKGAQLEDRLYNNTAFEQPDVDPNDPQQQDAALKIQTKYRQHHSVQVVQDKREDQAATKIQAGFRGFQGRQKVKNIKTESDQASQQAAEEAEHDDLQADEEVAAVTKDEQEVDIDLNDPEVAAAATKIQASFKGFKARQEVQEMKKNAAEGEAAPEASAEEDGVATETKTEDEEVDIDLNDPEVAAAATKIQAGFKGYKARKDVEALKEARREDSGDANAAGETELVQSEAADSENKEADETQNEAEQAQNEAQPEATAEPGEEKQKGDDVNQDEEKDTKEKAEESAQDASEIDFETAEVAQAKVDTEGKQDDDDKDRSETPASMGSDGQTAEATPGDAAVGDVTDDAAVTQQQEQTTSEAGEKNMEETPEKTGDASPLVVEEQHVDQPGPSPDHSTAADEQKDGDVKDDDVIATTDGSPAEATKQAEEEIEDDGGKPLDLKTDETEDSPPPKDATASDANGGETLEKEPQQQDQQQESKSGTAASPDKAPEASDEEETTVESTEEPKAEENKVEAEAEVDIDLKDPEVEKAATKIQAGFKGMKARKEVRERKGEGQHEEDEGPKEAVEEKKDDEKEDVDIDLKDPEVEKAATKIQAGFKGMKARKEVKSMRTEDGATEDSQEKPEAEEEAEKQADKPEEIDIDLNDPQVNAAATKIQATFKGHKTRKDMKGKKGDGEAAADGDAVNNEEGDGKGNNDTPAE